MTSLREISLGGRADIGRYCQCFMQNTNNRIGKYIFSLFAPSTDSKLINDPILDHFILLRSDSFDFRYPRISFKISRIPITPNRPQCYFL